MANIGIGTMRVDIEGRDRYSRAARSAGAGARRFEKDINRVAVAAERQQRAIRILSRGLVVIGGVAAISRGIRALGRYSDEYTKVANTVKLTTAAEGDRAVVLDNLNQLAQRSLAPLAETSQLYQRIALAQKDLGLSTAETLGVTESVAKALAVQGTSAEAARGALLQLGQGLGSGVFRAEEFNSLLENMPYLLEVVARQMYGASGSVAQLRNAVKDGEVTSRAFAQAIRDAGPEIEEAFANAEKTFSQSTTAMGNAMTRLGANIVESLSGTAVQDAFDFVTSRLDRLADRLSSENLVQQRVLRAEIELRDSGPVPTRDPITDRLRDELGQRAQEFSENQRRAQARRRFQIDLPEGAATRDEARGQLENFRPRGADALDARNKRYEVLEEERLEIEKKYAEERAENERVIAEAAANREAELQTAAATRFREAEEAKVKAAEEAAQKIAERQATVNDLFASGFTSALLNADQSFGDFARNFIRQIAQMIIQQEIFNALQNASGGGIGGFFTSIFGGGRQYGGAVYAGNAYMTGETGREVFVPNTDGYIIPNHQLGRGQGSTPVNVNLTVQSADSAAIRRGIADAIPPLENSIRAAVQNDLTRPGPTRRR